MGCSGSKEKKPSGAAPEVKNTGAAADTNVGTTSNTNRPVGAAAQPRQQSPSNRSVETPAGRAATNSEVVNTNVDSTPTKTAPGKGPRTAGTESAPVDVDEEGNAIVLPKGDWIKTEGTPYYYSALENLYYHPPSCQFYDPTNEMWFDPEKNEWYHDDASDEEGVTA